MDVNDDKYSIKIVERSFKILDLASEVNRPISIQDVCNELSVNTNMAFRLLNSLVSTGYMFKDDYTGMYGISLKTLRLSRNALLTLEIRKVSMAYLEVLWSQCPKANLNFGVYEQGEVLVLGRIDSTNLPRTYFTPGRTLPFHCSGLGKILTCQLPENEIDSLILDKGLKQYTENTITTPEGIKAELKKVASEQVARDRNEFIAGDNCSAAPIYGKDNKIIAAISASAFDTYMPVDEIEGLLPKLKETARKISYNLGHMDGI